MSEPMRLTCDDCGKTRTGGQACEHCGTCPECGSTDDSPPTFSCAICDREGEFTGTDDPRLLEDDPRLS